MEFKRNLQESELSQNAELVLKTVNPELGGHSLGSGMLYVGQQCLSWLADLPAETSTAQQKGFVIGYPDLHMHATSKDGSIHTQPCVFCMLAYDSEVPEWWPIVDSSPGSGSSSLILPTASAAETDSLFAAISKCSALHPDTDDDESPSMGGGPGAGEWITADSLAGGAGGLGSAEDSETGGAAAAGDQGGVQLADPEEYDAEALAAWEAKFIPPPSGVQGAAHGQFDD